MPLVRKGQPMKRFRVLYNGHTYIPQRHVLLWWRSLRESTMYDDQVMEYTNYQTCVEAINRYCSRCRHYPRHTVYGYVEVGQ